MAEVPTIRIPRVACPCCGSFDYAIRTSRVVTLIEVQRRYCRCRACDSRFNIDAEPVIFNNPAKLCCQTQTQRTGAGGEGTT